MSELVRIAFASGVLLPGSSRALLGLILFCLRYILSSSRPDPMMKEEM